MAYYLVLSDRVLRDVATSAADSVDLPLLVVGETAENNVRRHFAKAAAGGEKVSAPHQPPKASTDHRFPQVVAVPQDSSLLSIIRVVWGFNISLSNDVLQAPYAGCMGQSQAVLWQCGCDEREVAMNPERHDSQAQYWES